MATILLQAAGGIVGGVLGGPFGAVLGRAVGGLAGASIDSALFGSTKRIEGPRLGNTRIMEADEGAGIARIYGTVRVAGQVIWTTRFEEVSTRQRQGGKGGAPKTETTTYSYYGNVAIGLCEGPVAGIRRVWADGEELDLTEVAYRVHPGDEAQAPDPLIEARQGAGNAPAYRGLAMSCSSAWRWSAGATAFRSSPARCCGRSAGWSGTSGRSPSFPAPASTGSIRRRCASGSGAARTGC